MAAGGGLSFINIGDKLKLQNLIKLSGSGTLSVLSGSLASLQTRQLSDALRVQLTGRAGGSSVISFELVYGSAPNDFGTQNGFLNVGCFGMFGFEAVEDEGSSGTDYPPNAFSGVTITLEAYSTTTITGSPIYTVTYPLTDPNFQSGSILTSMPRQSVDALPAFTFGPLDAVGPQFPKQGWGNTGVGATVPKSFRVKITVPSHGATGNWIMDIGRLWLGNALRPAGGVANVAYNIIDPSQVTNSRDGQVYDLAFSRMRSMGLTFPALTELEAIGLGPSPLTASPANLLRWHNDLTTAMYVLGLSGNCVMWATDDFANGGQVNYGPSHVIYGRPTSWQNLQWAQARKQTQDSITNNQTGRIWTGGLSVQEER